MGAEGERANFGRVAPIVDRPLESPLSAISVFTLNVSGDILIELYRGEECIGKVGFNVERSWWTPLVGSREVVLPDLSNRVERRPGSQSPVFWISRFRSCSSEISAALVLRIRW